MQPHPSSRISHKLKQRSLFPKSSCTVATSIVVAVLDCPVFCSRFHPPSSLLSISNYITSTAPTFWEDAICADKRTMHRTLYFEGWAGERKGTGEGMSVVPHLISSTSCHYRCSRTEGNRHRYVTIIILIIHGVYVIFVIAHNFMDNFHFYSFLKRTISYLSSASFHSLGARGYIISGYIVI